MRHIFDFDISSSRVLNRAHSHMNVPGRSHGLRVLVTRHFSAHVFYRLYETKSSCEKNLSSNGIKL